MTPTTHICMTAEWGRYGPDSVLRILHHGEALPAMARSFVGFVDEDRARTLVDAGLAEWYTPSLPDGERRHTDDLPEPPKTSPKPAAKRRGGGKRS